MESKSNIKLEVVWGAADDHIRSSAMDFWKQEGVITNPEVLSERAKQLVVVAYDKSGTIIATSTALKSQVKLLNNNWLYQYRCYVSPRARVIGFDVHLTKESLRVLEEQSLLEQERMIGVFVVVENPKLNNNKINNAAVWRAYKMYFIGFTSKGQPIRVYYFKGAQI